MTISPPSEIKGARIYLKKPNLSFQEADQLFHVAQRNQDHLLPWLAWAQKTNKPEDSFLFLTQMNTLWKEEKRFEYLIYEMSTHDLIGGIGAAHSDSSRPHKIELGYWLDKDHCHKGYMQEAIRLIEDVFFGLGIIRIIIRNDLDNHASVQTAQASNYILEGVARKDKWNPIFNEYRDLNIWVKIKETASN